MGSGVPAAIRQPTPVFLVPRFRARTAKNAKDANRNRELASGTSKKTELKLTNVARASLEELGLDYEDVLRQRGIPMWPPDHPALKRFKAMRCATLDDVRKWIEAERARGSQVHTNTLSRLNLATHLLDRQLAAQASAFEREGGFTERLYRIRTEKKRSM